ncbi:hypothetical protein CTEN210_16793 [Chaetoceros tenuissimus]|uniref:Uncharacterized protein n=1 Tax=Chaetoceros tenuissimus TaxID=426638 RepID=A0AAD3HDY0_9STRA|nr:hypothetical protein CTEN210_16793 [Chaetoceros tenuissimus]
MNTRVRNLSLSEHDSRCFDEMWKEMFFRHLFAPAPKHKEHSNGGYYIQECRKRRRLLNNLTRENDHVKSYKRRRQNSSSTNANKTESLIKCIGHSNGMNSSRHDWWSPVQSCFSIPNDCFKFIPVHAQMSSGNIQVLHQNDDMPPVDFTCTSYLLTSPSTGGEFVLLNPISGEIVVYNDVKDLVSTSKEQSEGNIRQELFQSIFGRGDSATAQASIVSSQANDSSNGHSQSHARNRQETLFSVQNYFNLNVADYFGRNDDRNENRNGFQAALSRDDEIVVEWLGIDSHCIYDTQSPSTLTGNAIVAARELTVHREENAQNFPADLRQTDEKTCTELIMWKKMVGEEDYASNKFLCRVQGSPYYMDTCPCKDIAFISLESGNCYDQAYESSPTFIIKSQSDDHIDHDSNLEDQTLGYKRSRNIHIFPLMHEGDVESRNKNFYPSTYKTIRCNRPVSAFCFDSRDNNLIVGTEGGKLEIWNYGETIERVQLIDAVDILLKTNLNSGTETPIRNGDYTIATSESDADAASLTDDIMMSNFTKEEEEFSRIRAVSFASALDHFNDSLANEESSESDEFHDSDSSSDEDEDALSIFSQCNPRRAVSQIILPNHSTARKTGFVTMQHDRSEGTSLTLWQYNKTTSQFEMSSIINLPLSPQRRPQVSFDGKRLVVFGQDHIGLIVLVYRVFSFGEDNHIDLGISNAIPQETSGGVISINSKNTVVYSNRIRHISLGGIEYYDSIFLTMNERYIILNTKSGDLGSVSNASTMNDGLLMIDLEF